MLAYTSSRRLVKENVDKRNKVYRTVGPISDRARCISDRWRLIIFAAFSQGAMAMGFLSLALITSPIAAQVVYTLSIVFSGVNVVGTIKCAQMVARQHVHAVMAVISFILCIIVLLVPIAVFVVCPDNTPQQWSRLFIGISVIVIIANIPFLFVARSEPAPWTSDKVSTNICMEKKSLVPTTTEVVLMVII
ncbi:hypothetical protein DICVIV_06759 [Dictyocaulus viviparus]|uniref:Uncharacterized protein n=1 Tax=Dictyocaulus viviparus TaxID=29172 RepID=A0A0D8XXW2_DICVI|nr:hypothetical protein DICVIV_06759 [Dictyocaulus viviparus]